MKAYGRGVVWDAKKKRPLARFVNGCCEVDETVARRLYEMGYLVDGEFGDEDDFPPMLLSLDELATLPLEQLADYANAHKVDIGRASTQDGLLKNIEESGKCQQKTEEEQG